MSVRLNRDNFEEIVLKNEKTVLVDFYSDSCGPCRRVSSMLAELEENCSDQLVVGKVNIAYEKELTEQYKVRSVPTLILFKNGIQKEALRGAKIGGDLEGQIKALL
ncbi:MAG: thioredoxin family protein [Lachnospiraceae bacterium]|nr:thioredoxin family protein [Lachnospiraceae bacterium]